MASPTIADALDDVDFPITKDELLAEAEGRTVAIGTDVVDLQDVVRRLDEDYFPTEDALLDAVRDTLGPLGVGEQETHKYDQTGMGTFTDAYEEMP